MASGTVFLLIFVALSAYVEWILYQRYLDYVELYKNGQNTEAVVVQLQVFTEENVRTTYRFKVPSGMEYEKRFVGVPEFLRNIRIGDNIVIRYLPSRPSVSYFADNMNQKIISAQVMLFIPPFCALVASVSQFF